MDFMNKEENKSNGWTWLIAIVVILGGLYFISQWRNNDQSAQADKIIKAKQACRWDGQRQGWDARAMATCDKVGTKDFTQSTDYYYEMYNAKVKLGL